MDEDGSICLAIIKSESWKPSTHIIDSKFIDQMDIHAWNKHTYIYIYNYKS